jgi:tetratricopeptide (TPR) repeat protein
MQLAQRAWDEHDRDKALYLCEQAVAKEPTNIRVMVNAARCFGLHHEPAKAKQLLSRIEKLTGGTAHAWKLIGQTYRLLRLPDLAIEAFEQSLNAEPESAKSDTTETRVELALLYELAGRLEEAGEQLEGVEAEGSIEDWKNLTEARIATRQKRSMHAEKMLRRVLDRPRSQADEPAVWQAWASIALLKDAEGDTQGALHALDQCKAPMLANAKPERQHAAAYRARIDEVTDALNAEVAQRWFEPIPTQPERVAILAGYPRSGTTLLENILDAHPDLASVEERDVLAQIVIPELTRFDGTNESIPTLIDGMTRQHLRRARKRYLSSKEQWLGEPLDGRMLLDKNPGATPHLPLFLRLFPEGKIVFAIRDPRDVLLSCYMRYIDQNAMSVEYLSMTAAARRYATEMRVWLKLRELIPGRFVEVRYEDLVDDFEFQSRRVVEALGLNWNDELLNYRERLNTKIVTSPTYAAVRAPISRKAIGRWQKYPQLFEPVQEVLAPFLDAFGYEH